MNYFYALNGKPLGPVQIEELQTLRIRGVINDTTLIVGEGESTWVAYAQRFPASAASRPAPPPLPSKTTEVAVQPVGVGELASPAAITKKPISAAAYKMAMSANNTKDEFNPRDTFELPIRKHSFSNSESNAPEFCLEGFRVVFGEHGVVGVILGLAIFNRSHQGPVRYNRAKASGGEELHLTLLNSEAVAPGTINKAWREFANVIIPLRLLENGLKEPLRIQISRPDEGLSFVLTISVDTAAAVLYKISPDSFEIDQMSMPPAENAKNPKSMSIREASMIGFGIFFVFWVFSPLGFYGSLILVGVPFGGFLANSYFKQRRA